MWKNSVNCCCAPHWCLHLNIPDKNLPCFSLKADCIFMSHHAVIISIYVNGANNWFWNDVSNKLISVYYIFHAGLLIRRNITRQAPMEIPQIFVVELCPLVVIWGSAKPGRSENNSFIMGYFVKCVLLFSKLKYTTWNIMRPSGDSQKVSNEKSLWK